MIVEERVTNNHLDVFDVKGTQDLLDKTVQCMTKERLQGLSADHAINEYRRRMVE